MRKPFIAGNWKMNNTIDEAIVLVNEIKQKLTDSDLEKVDVAVCVPAISLSEVSKLLKGTKIKLGAQNMHWEENGAFTGETSPLMLKALGVDYCIVGHSERRQFFAETDETVNNKVRSAIAHDISPILCVGETLQQREQGIEKKVVESQIFKALESVSERDMARVVVAYEPIWAIGTGKTATNEQANDMCLFIRNTLKEEYGREASNKAIIQYGGSVKPENVSEIMSESDIDGALVGGASLKADDFAKLVKF